jgi:hypothetical protein
MPEGNRPNPPANVAHWSVLGTVAGTSWANTFWVRNGSGIQPSATDFANAVADMHLKWVQYFIEHVNTDVIVTGSDGLYYGTTGADLGFTYQHQDTGSFSGTVLPAQVATGISWAIQAHYKGGHPRTYLPAPAQSALFSSRLFNPSHANAVRGAANSFLTAINATSHGSFNDVHLGTVSFVLRKQWRTPPVFRDFIPGQATVDQRIDTQRRRLGRDL